MSLSAILVTSSLLYAGSDHASMQYSNTQGDMPMNGNIQDMKAGKGLKMSPERMQKRRAMRVEVVQIQKDPDLKKRQELMSAHMQKMQGMIGSIQGMNISSEIMQKRRAMQAEMMKITNEPNLQKRQKMLAQYMKKMQVMMDNMGGIKGIMPMRNSNKMEVNSGEHKH